MLAHYTTYKTYFQIEKAIAENPEYDQARARRAIARFVTLHPHNLAQRAEKTVLDYYAQRLYERLRAEHDQLGLAETPRPAR